MTSLPHTYHVRTARAARCELLDIFHHVSQSSPQGGASVLLGLSAAIDSLASWPTRHKTHRDSPRADRVIRAMSVPLHIVYYRVREQAKQVVVVAVRHGARRPPTRFPTT